MLLRFQSGHNNMVILERYPMEKIPAAQFKSQCLAVMDQVAESGRPMVVT